MEVSGAWAACETQKLGQLRAAIHLHLARVLSAYGRLPEATALLDRLAEDILAQDTPLPPALEPLRIHFALLEGDWGGVRSVHGRPDDTAPLHVLCADASTIKAKIELIQGQPDRALVLLDAAVEFHRAGPAGAASHPRPAAAGGLSDRLGERTLAQQNPERVRRSASGSAWTMCGFLPTRDRWLWDCCVNTAPTHFDLAYRRAVRDAAQRCAQAYPRLWAHSPTPSALSDPGGAPGAGAIGPGDEQPANQPGAGHPSAHRQKPRLPHLRSCRCAADPAINAAKERGLPPRSRRSAWREVALRAAMPAGRPCADAPPRRIPPTSARRGAVEKAVLAGGL